MTQVHARDSAAVPAFPMRRPARCPLGQPPDYPRLRAERPVAVARLYDDSRLWLLTRHKDVRAVLAVPRVSANQNAPGFPVPTPELRRIVLELNTNVGMLRTDPPRHDVLRRIVIRDFTVKRVEAMRPAIQRLVDERIDDLLAGDKPADLVTALALPVPSTVICWLLGVPVADQADFNRWSRLTNAAGVPAEQQATANAALLDYLRNLIVVKERHPGDDIISRLIEQREAGTIDAEEVLANTTLMLAAGHETTANMIALGTLTLLRHPEQAAALRDDPSLARNAVVATEDIEIGGQVIRAGDGIAALNLAANRDPEAFADPDTLDIRRDTRRHVAFGYGVHQCLGQNLARAELQVVYPTLLRRIPSLRLAVELDEVEFRLDDPLFGLTSLPVTWD
ncbi:cytochrome P450 [Amycolatopsis anabasis]|uniref:cytochrome P450 n=1 Tax=Amycolatopsis anabasis TaxID=1840409 RepID=UPI00131E382F|nr:cytochrome P450 [Amycolatopsis anabasis]